MKKKLISILTAAMVILCACGSPAAGESRNTDPSQPSDSAASEESDNEKQETQQQNTDSSAKTSVTDPSGAEITLPDEINSIVVLAPSLSEIVISLDLGDKVTGYDSYSAGLAGVASQ